MSFGDNRKERKFLLFFSGAMVLLVVIFCLLAPNSQEDMMPTTYNSASAGAKAAFMILQALGRNPQRWDRPFSELNSVDAAHTTVVIAEPQLTDKDETPFAADIAKFLHRGGRVLLTGAEGDLLPGGEIGRPRMFQKGLCYTKPEGFSSLANAGEIEISEHSRWSAEGPQFDVAQRCGNDAVVVRFPVGKGEAIWWSSSTPLSNVGLKRKENLKLFLASIGDGSGVPRTILFDEYHHSLHGAFLDPTKGLPLPSLWIQGTLLFVLLLLSFSRRAGPLRMPVLLPRSSPVEFAESMGDLYAKASATTAAVQAAQRRFHRLLHREAGIPLATIRLGPQSVREALEGRLGGDWADVEEHLDQAAAFESANISPHSALQLVRAFAEDEERIRATLQPRDAGAFSLRQLPVKEGIS